MAYLMGKHHHVADGVMARELQVGRKTTGPHFLKSVYVDVEKFRSRLPMFCSVTVQFVLAGDLHWQTTN